MGVTKNVAISWEVGMKVYKYLYSVHVKCWEVNSTNIYIVSMLNVGR